MYYSMREACCEAEMPYETLKYYCNMGLVPNVKRDKNNYRVFSEHDVEWIKSLACLKNCNMSIEDMQKYLALCLEGPSSIPRRQEMLAEKKAQLLNKIKKLEEALEYINWKQGFYRDVLDGKTKYFSNLLPEEFED